MLALRVQVPLKLQRRQHGKDVKYQGEWLNWPTISPYPSFDELSCDEPQAAPLASEQMPGITLSIMAGCPHECRSCPSLLETPLFPVPEITILQILLSRKPGVQALIPFNIPRFPPRRGP